MHGQQQDEREKASNRAMQSRKWLRLLQTRPALQHLQMLAPGDRTHKGNINTQQLALRKTEMAAPRLSVTSSTIRIMNWWWPCHLGGTTKAADAWTLYISIYGNGNGVKAKVIIDESDSAMGCDSSHDYHPLCPNNVVDVSKAVRKALGVPEIDLSWTKYFSSLMFYLSFFV